MAITDAELVHRVLRDMDDCDRCPDLGRPGSGTLPADRLIDAMDDHVANHQSPRVHGLPTPGQMLAQARDELTAARDRLSEAAAWLRSDWQPLGAALTTAQAKARRTGFNKIVVASAAIDAATRAIDAATDREDHRA